MDLLAFAALAALAARAVLVIWFQSDLMEPRRQQTQRWVQKSDGQLNTPLRVSASIMFILLLGAAAVNCYRSTFPVTAAGWTAGSALMITLLLPMGRGLLCSFCFGVHICFWLAWMLCRSVWEIPPIWLGGVALLEFLELKLGPIEIEEVIEEDHGGSNTNHSETPPGE